MQKNHEAISLFLSHLIHCNKNLYEDTKLWFQFDFNIELFADDSEAQLDSPEYMAEGGDAESDDSKNIAEKTEAHLDSLEDMAEGGEAESDDSKNIAEKTEEVDGDSKSANKTAEETKDVQNDASKNEESDANEISENAES